MGSKLALQGFGLGADDHSLSPRGTEEGRRQQIGKGLAHACAGLKKADAAVAQHGRRLGSQLYLAGAVTKAREAPGKTGGRSGVARAARLGAGLAVRLALWRSELNPPGVLGTR